jgi:hypothetical protein
MAGIVPSHRDPLIDPTQLEKARLLDPGAPDLDLEGLLTTASGTSEGREDKSDDSGKT